MPLAHYLQIRSEKSLTILLLFISGLTRVAIFSSLPFLSLIVADKTDASITTIGAITGISSLTFGLISPFGGKISDKFGHVQMMIGTAIIISILFFSLIFAVDAVYYFTVVLLIGACLAFFDPATLAALSEVVSSKHKTRIFSRRCVCVNTGVFLGPVFGSILIEKSRLIFFILPCAIFAVTAALLTANYSIDRAFFDRNSSNIFYVNREENIRKIIAKLKFPKLFFETGTAVRRSVFVYTTISFMFSCTYTQLTSTFPLYLRSGDFLSSFYGVLLSFGALLAIITQFAFPKITKFYSLNRNLEVGSIFVGLGTVFLFLSSSAIYIALSVTLIAIGEALFSVAVVVLVEKELTQHNYGIGFGIFSMSSLGFFAGALLSAWLVDRLGFRTASWILAPLPLLACYVSNFFLRPAQVETPLLE